MTPTHLDTRRRLLRRTSSVVVAGVSVLSVAACGDDSKTANETSVETTIDSSAYVAAGNKLCNETAVAIDNAFPDFAGEPTTAQVMQLGVDLGPVLQSFHDGVAALDPPPDLADDHQRLLDALEDSIDTLLAMATSETGANAALDAGGPPLDEPSNAAHAIFPECPAGDE